MAAVALAVVLLVPRVDQEAVVGSSLQPDAAVKVHLMVDSVEAARGFMKVRISASPVEGLQPPEGLVVVARVESGAQVTLRVGSSAEEAPVEVPFLTGDIAAYPFDTYRAGISISAVRGRAGDAGAAPEPMSITGVDSSVGYDVDGNFEVRPNQVDMHLVVTRKGPVVGWACIMMALYWLLAFAVLSVTALVVLSLREWESRHLAWLATMLFAFASFRATAPGNPPVGVYLDYAAFFWAEVIVGLSLMALVAFYLIGGIDPARSTEGPPGDGEGPGSSAGPSVGPGPGATTHPDAATKDDGP